MKVIALNASPNADGLTATMAKAVLAGAAEAGAETLLVNMKSMKLKACLQCDDGWGQCRREGTCILTDDLQSLREDLWGADAIVIANPVYFGEMAEVAKNFLDRLRRCEVAGPGDKKMAGKLGLGIAAAGGSGGGIVSCQVVLERYFQHLGMRVFDMIPVTRLTREYKIEVAKLAGKALAQAEA
jgi:multimeric flavodoxin WrbA